MGEKPLIQKDGERVIITLPSEEVADRWFHGLQETDFEVLDDGQCRHTYSVCMIKYFNPEKTPEELLDLIYKKVEGYMSYLDRMPSDYPKIRELEKNPKLVSFKFSKTKNKIIKKVQSGIALKTPSTTFDTAVYLTQEEDCVSLLITNFNSSNGTALFKLKNMMSLASNGNERYVSFKDKLAEIALNFDVLRHVAFDPEYPIPPDLMQKIQDEYGDAIDVENFKISNELKVKKDIGRTLDLKSYPEIRSMLKGLIGHESITTIMGIKKGTTVKIVEESGEPMKIIFYPLTKEVITKGEYQYILDFIKGLGGDTTVKKEALQTSLSNVFEEEK